MTLVKASAGLSTSRFVGFVATCLLGAILLEDPLTINGAVPDFAVIAVVYGAMRTGAFGGAIAGFGLGLFRDTLLLADFGLNALGLTVIGYVVGKLGDTLYLNTPGVDLLMLAVAKISLEVLVLAVAASGSWPAFEQRFFWEAPASAVYTALLGGLIYRLYERL